MTAFILLVFGGIRGYLTGSRVGWIWIIISAIETLAVGGVAAGASYGIVRALDKNAT